MISSWKNVGLPFEMSVSRKFGTLIVIQKYEANLQPEIIVNPTALPQ